MLTFSLNHLSRHVCTWTHWGSYCTSLFIWHIQNCKLNPICHSTWQSTQQNMVFIFINSNLLHSTHLCLQAKYLLILDAAWEHREESWKKKKGKSRTAAPSTYKTEAQDLSVYGMISGKIKLEKLLEWIYSCMRKVGSHYNLYFSSKFHKSFWGINNSLGLLFSNTIKVFVSTSSKCFFPKS